MKLTAFLVALLAANLARGQQFDLLVYEATPAGIAAAWNAARQNRSVALVESTGRIGGLLTSGLSYSDFRTFEVLSGTFREYARRVEAYYETTYGADSPQVKDSYFGTLAEPKVSLMVLEQMLAEQPKIRLYRRHVLSGVKTAGGRIVSATFNGGTRLTARFFIDASYEGDLMAKAGAPYRVGRESTRDYGERLAGHIFFKDGRVLPGSTGEGDKHVQTYNYRITMTSRAENMLPVPRPAGYSREPYLKLLNALRSGEVKRVYSLDHSGVLRLQRIANGKADMNDIKNAPIRLSLPGAVDAYPEGTPEVRRQIELLHRVYNQGLLYFLQNDAEVPDAIRAEARQWGLPKDEFPETGNFPPRIYVREARRMLGEYVFREQDALMSADSIRAPLHRDAIAIGDYALNCHGEQAPGPVHPTVTEGDFSGLTQPFQIPYRVIVPKKVTNLLVPVAVSATHVGFSALRLEPTWTALGQAAGLAADLALRSNVPARSVKVEELQAMLHQRQANTIYVTDVPGGHPRYAMVQYFGTRGYLHPIVNKQEYEWKAQKLRHGLQYSYAFTDHAAGLDKQLDDRLKASWDALTRSTTACTPPAAARTRGEYLEQLWRCVSPRSASTPGGSNR